MTENINTPKIKDVESYHFLLKNYIKIINNPDNLLINLSAPLLDFVIKSVKIRKNVDAYHFYDYIKNELVLLKDNPEIMQDDDSKISFHFILCDFIDEVIISKKLVRNPMRDENLMKDIFYPEKEKIDEQKLSSIVEKYITGKYQSNDLLEFIYLCLRLGYNEPIKHEEYIQHIELTRKVYSLLFDKNSDFFEGKLGDFIQRNKYAKKFSVLYKKGFYFLYKIAKNEKIFKQVDSDTMSFNILSILTVLLILINIATIGFFSWLIVKWLLATFDILKFQIWGT